MLTPDTPRLALLIEPRAGLHDAEFDTGLRDLSRMLGCAGGAGAQTRAARRIDGDPLGALLAQRGAVGAVGAELELTLAAGADPGRLLEFSGIVSRGLAELADPASTRLVAGKVHFVRRGEGPVLVLVGGRRAAGTTPEQMTRWWIDQHAVLAQRIVRPPPRSYEQLHGDRTVSERLCESCGVVFEPLDMWDSIAVGSVDEFLQAVQEPDVSRQLYEDELGHVDHYSMRGAVCRVL
jgi:hypothetical protein